VARTEYASPAFQEYRAELKANLPFGRRLARRILAEIDDHLSEATDSLQRDGLALSDAQTRAIERFGTPRTVAETFARSRGMGMPTTTTRLSGLAAMLMPVTLFFGLYLVDYDGWGDGGHWVGSALLVGFFGQLIFLFMGLWKRHAGSLGYWGKAAITILFASPFLSVPFAWAAPVAMIAYLWLAFILLSIGIWRAHKLPRTPMLLCAIGPAYSVLVGAIGAVTGFDGARYMLVGGLPPMAVGLVWMGYVLWSEQTEKAPPDAPVAFA
jgi:hypothetical protein